MIDVSLLQSLVTGILMGGLYGILALGVGLVWGVMKVSNFAHGALIILAAYGAYWLERACRLDPLFSFIFVGPLFFVAGFPLYYGLIKPIQERAREWWMMAALLALFALSSCLESLMLFFWTATPRTLVASYFGVPSFSFLGCYVPTTRLVAFIISILGVLVIALFIGKTRLGKAMRATSQDKEAALLVGINTDKMSALSCSLGGVLAALAGVAISITFPFTPVSGLYWCIKAFVVVVLGGLGSFIGSLVGGMILGLTESICGSILPFQFTQLFSLIIFVLIVIFRPKGLFGKV